MNDTELAAGFIVSVDGAAMSVPIMCLYIVVDWTRPKCRSTLSLYAKTAEYYRHEKNACVSALLSRSTSHLRIPNYSIARAIPYNCAATVTAVQ